MIDLQQEHPDIHEYLASMQVCIKQNIMWFTHHSSGNHKSKHITFVQAKSPEELEEYLDQVDSPTHQLFDITQILALNAYHRQLEAATDTRLQFKTTGRLIQTFERLRFLDE
jgi:hypothetical protein